MLEPMNPAPPVTKIAGPLTSISLGTGLDPRAGLTRMIAVA
ncbi:MAG: hypothetical protein FD124_1737, partial [Alphaproteobacteria bacterium]